MKKIIIPIVVVIGLHCVLQSVNQPKQKNNTQPTTQETIKLIQSLISQNQKVSVLLAHPLLPGKVRLWQQRGIMRPIVWANVIQDIHQFGLYLALLLKKNPQKGTYYYIDKIKADHSFYNTLDTIHNNLELYLSKIQKEKETPFKIAKESVIPLQKIINLYVTQLYQNKLFDTIKKQMKPFEKEAQEMRVKQEESARKAGQKSISEYEYDEYEYDLDAFDLNEQDYGDHKEESYNTKSDDASSIFSIFGDNDEEDFVSSFFE